MLITNKAVDRVIVTVDVGTDDYLGLMMLLLAEKIGVLIIQAIICAYGNTSRDNSCKNVARLLEMQKRKDIPLYRGTNTSIIIPDQFLIDGYFFSDGFGDLNLTEPDTSFIKKKPGAEVIKELVNKYPNKISILCLGPLTELAIALQLDQDLTDKIKEVWVMGGNYPVNGEEPMAEFNFKADPEAAHIVLQRSKPLYIFTFEAGLTSNITMDWRFSIKAKSPSFELATRVEQKIQNRDQVVKYSPYDAIITSIFLNKKKNIIKETAKNGYVELRDEKRGQIIYNNNANFNNLRIIEEFNQEEFKKTMNKIANMPR